MYRFGKYIAALALGMSAVVSVAQAAVSLDVSVTPKAHSQLVDSGIDAAPIAFYKFCAQYQRQCHSSDLGARVELNSGSWAMLSLINSEVNGRIKGDAEKGAYDWSLTTMRGNCNDYAVQKRNALMNAGFPMSALSLSAVKTGWGEGHLVLTVRTTKGDFVLDNLRRGIVSWEDTGYEWVSIQSNEDPSRWVHVKSVPMSIVAENTPSQTEILLPHSEPVAIAQANIKTDKALVQSSSYESGAQPQGSTPSLRLDLAESDPSDEIVVAASDSGGAPSEHLWFSYKHTFNPAPAGEAGLAVRRS